MYTIVEIPKHDNTKRIVIIGGGFAGLELAKRVDKKQYQVVLIDKNNYHQFQPLFYQVATAGLDPSSICYPLRKDFHRVNNFHFRMCEARQVYAQEKRVVTTIGDLYYDYLVVATGCDTNYFGSDNLRESTYALKSISEAILIRNRILLSLEQAANNTNKEELNQFLCFTIIGGGATGVELAGALADMKKFVLPKDYPEINFEKMEIHLIDASPRLLAGLSERASKTASDTLRKRGVILHLNVRVTAYDKPIVKLSDSTELYSDNVFWVGGVKANNIVGLSESAYLHGRLAVDEYNEVVGHKDIFAIGDTSLLVTEANPKGHPQVAQVALQMARSLARNLNHKARRADKAKRFEYINKGSMATIGKNAAVADIGRLYFSGILAWWIWLLVHIMSMIGIRNRISVLIDWIWNYFGYGLSLRLFIRPKSSKIYDE